METVTTLAYLVLALLWMFCINAVWFYARQFHRSKPPGRQTVVSDLIILCTYFFNLNICLTGLTTVYKLLATIMPLPQLSCSMVSFLVFLWESSICTLCGIATCLNIIRFSVTHCWTWIHEWTIHQLYSLFTIIIGLHLIYIWLADCFMGYMANDGMINIVNGTLTHLIVDSTNKISKGCFETLLLILNEIDKRITFHRVLGVEAMSRVGRFSNTEYVVKSWIMIVTALFGLVAAFFNTIYNSIYREQMEMAVKSFN